MARKSSPSKFFHALFLPIAIVLGLVFIVILYKAATSTTELRSKASGELPYQAWYFDKKDPKTWDGSARMPVNYPYTKGNLHAVIRKSLTAEAPSVFSTNAKSLPRGIKRIEFRLAVTLPKVPKPTVIRRTPTPTVKIYPSRVLGDSTIGQSDQLALSTSIYPTTIVTTPYPTTRVTTPNPTGIINPIQIRFVYTPYVNGIKKEIPFIVPADGIIRVYTLQLVDDLITAPAFRLEFLQNSVVGTVLKIDSVSVFVEVPITPTRGVTPIPITLTPSASPTSISCLPPGKYCQFGSTPCCSNYSCVNNVCQLRPTMTPTPSFSPMVTYIPTGYPITRTPNPYPTTYIYPSRTPTP